jgi:6-phosphogluconolactonase (cycloisomerase 2 family)
MRTWLSLLLVLTLAGIAASQQAETPAEQASRIDMLIRQLDADSFSARQKAQMELAEIGEAAFEQLTAAAKDSSVERSQRATALLKEIRLGRLGLRHLSTVRHDGLLGAVTLVISPDGQFVYVPAFQGSAINVFRRDAITGSLEHQQSLVDGVQMGGVVTLRLSRDGKHAVAAAYRSKSIILLSRNANTGDLSIESVRQHEPDGELKLTWPIDAIFSTDGRFVYAVDDQGASVIVFRVEEDKRLVLIETFQGEERCLDGARGLFPHPDGKTIYVSSRRPGTLTVLDRDPTSGKLGVRQVLRDEENDIHGLAGATETCVSRDGKFVYAISGRFEGDNAVNVFKVGADGKLTLLQELQCDQAGIQNLSGANDLTLSPDEEHLYVSGTTSCSVACFRRDRASGKLTYEATLQSEATGVGAELGANGLQCSPDGRFLYLALENNSAISIFERTGKR